MWTMNFLMFKLVLEKAEEPEIKLPTSSGSWKKQEFQKNIYFCFIDCAKAFNCVDHNKLWKILNEMGIPVLSDSLKHARLPCPSPSPGVCSNSCPLSWWYHPTISSSVIPFSSCLQSFPPAFSFLSSQFFTSGGQIIGASVSASVLPLNIQGWFPLRLTGLNYSHLQ